jgi:uncharacterized membrane protein
MSNEQYPIAPANDTDEELTLSQRFADAVTEGMGSWKFVIGQTAVIAAWIGVNARAFFNPWDPATILNLVLSTEAAYAASFVLMSQKRRAEQDRLTAQNDYLIDLKCEKDIQRLERKTDLVLDILLTTATIPSERRKEIMAMLYGLPAPDNDNGNDAVKPAVEKPAP